MRMKVSTDIIERFQELPVQIYVHEDWMPLIELCNRDLALIDPYYRIDQIKNKFGGLRYYYTPSGDCSLDDHELMNKIVANYEEKIDEL